MSNYYLCAVGLIVGSFSLLCLLGYPYRLYYEYNKMRSAPRIFSDAMTKKYLRGGLILETILFVLVVVSSILVVLTK